LRFAVRRLGNPYASPRSRRPSDGDIARSVNVCVAYVSAGIAGEDGLALACLRIHLPACRATLRSVCGRNLLNSSLGLLIKAGNEHSPGIFEYPSVKSCFLGNASAGFCGGAPCRARHCLHIERFDSDQIEAYRQVRCDLFAPVLTHVRLMPPQLGYASPHFRSPVGATPATSQASLQLTQSALPPAAQLSHSQEFTGAQGSANLDASVHSHDAAVAGSRDRWRNHREGDVPAAGTVQRHAERLCAFRYRARDAKSHPSRFGYPDLGDVAVKSSNVGRSDGYNSEPLMLASFSPSRSVMGSRQVVSNCLRKVTKSLLLHYLTSSAQPIVLSSRRGELTTLLQVSRRTITPRTPPRMLLYGKVPHETCMRTVSLQNSLLRGSRVQAVSGHESNITAASDILGEVELGVSFGKVPGLAAPACS
jgi:hypothetical protein